MLAVLCGQDRGLTRLGKKSLPISRKGASMLRQFFTTDPTTINAQISAYQAQAGPKVVARLAPGADPVEISAARKRDGRLQVQVGRNGLWREPFACYKDEP
jgi:hypothetical protein